MSIEILKGDAGIQPYLRTLIYGASGVGKTVFGSTAPKPLFLSAEGGMLSVKGKNVDSTKIETISQLEAAFEYLKNSHHEYQSVVIDSLTEIVQQGMDWALEKSKRETPIQRDYLVSIEKLRRLIRGFRDLPMHVIFIALRDDVKEGEGDNVKIRHRPLIVGKLTEAVVAYVDDVLYMFTQDSKEGVQRYVLTQHTEKFYAKNRSGKLDKFEDPDFTSILKKTFHSNGGN